MSATTISGTQWCAPGDTPGDRSLVLKIAGGTDVGQLRQVNEDAWLASPPVFLVADGMGGHAAGDVASAKVVSVFEPLAGAAVTRDDVEAAIKQCFDGVGALAVSQDAAPGSTLTLLARVSIESDRRWLLVNVGDSRTYLFADDRLLQLSHDHSVVQELLDEGSIGPAEARVHPDRHVITRSIGGTESTEADVTWLEIPSASRLLLCSDGLCGEIDDDQIADILRHSVSAEQAVAALIAAANAAGGHDNITAIVMDVDAADGAREDTLRQPVIDVVDENTVPGRKRRA